MRYFLSLQIKVKISWKERDLSILSLFLCANIIWFPCGLFYKCLFLSFAADPSFYGAAVISALIELPDRKMAINFVIAIFPDPFGLNLMKKEIKDVEIVDGNLKDTAKKVGSHIDFYIWAYILIYYLKSIVYCKSKDVLF